MGINPVDVMDLVRQRRGMAPVNSQVIDGQPNLDPISEEERSEQELVARLAEDGAGVDERTETASSSGQASPPSPPQIPTQVTHMAIPQSVPDPDFVFVMTGENCLAGVKGREVTLSPQSMNRIKAIILSDWQRGVMAEVRALKGRRRKRDVVPTSGVVEGVKVAAPTLRKRGRPKGSRNKVSSAAGKVKVVDAPEPTGNSAG